MDCAHRSVPDAPRSPWRSPAMSLPRKGFAGLIKARFPGRAGMQERALPSCAAASLRHTLPEMHSPNSALAGTTPSNGAPTDTRNKPPIHLSEI